MADRPNNRGRKSRKKVCGFCVDKVEHIDYKDIAGTCARHQRDLTTSIKRARHLALLPYTAD